MEARGLYEDPRAFHFLLPVLRRGGHDHKILERIDVAYVTEALAADYAERATSANLGTAIDVAEKLGDLPSLVRLGHLLASVQTRFSERFYEELYGKTFAKLKGVRQGPVTFTTCGVRSTKRSPQAYRSWKVRNHGSDLSSA